MRTMITTEEIEVLKEWVKEQYNGNIDSDILFLFTKLIVEKENELSQQPIIPTVTPDIQPITVNPTSPTITQPRPWNPYSPYEVWAGVPIKTNGGSGANLDMWTTSTTKEK